MSEATIVEGVVLDQNTPVTAEKSVVKLSAPSWSAATTNSLNRDFTPDAYAATAGDKKKRAAYIARVKSTFGTVVETGQKLDDTRTYAGAYVQRVMSADEGASGNDIAAVLGVAPSSVTRYKYIAQLHFDLGFDRSDAEWPLLTNTLVSKSVLTARLKKKDVQRSDVFAAIAEWATFTDEEKKSGKKSEKSDGGNGGGEGGEGDENTRTPRTPAAGEPVGNGKRLEDILTLVGAMTDADADDIASLFLIRERVAALITAAPEDVRLAGRATYDKLHGKKK